MKTKILIDLASIKRNKDAGSMTTNVLAGSETTFTCRSMPEELKLFDEPDIVILRWDEEKGIKTNLQGWINSQFVIDKIINEKIKGISIKTTYDRQVIRHQPIAPYSYLYVNTEVTCSNCKEKIMTDDLGSDEIVGDGWSDEICPKCYQADYFELEFETIEEAMMRKTDANF